MGAGSSSMDHTSLLLRETAVFVVILRSCLLKLGHEATTMGSVVLVQGQWHRLGLLFIVDIHDGPRNIHWWLAIWNGVASMHCAEFHNFIWDGSAFMVGSDLKTEHSRSSNGKTRQHS